MRLRSRLFGLILALLAIQGSPAVAGCVLGKLAELPVTMRGLRPTVTGKVNGVEASFLFDSGAFFSMLSPASVKRFDLRPQPAPPNLVLTGVGGNANAELATAHEFDFGGMTYHQADFLINEKALGSNVAGLIGANMTALADIEYDLADGVIRLFKPEGCRDASFAYWAGDKPFSVINIEPTSVSESKLSGVATVNGVKIKVIFDTGSPTSILERSAAARAGVTPQTPGVINAGGGAGLGLRSYFQSWIGPFASFKIGDEEIKNTRLRFGNMDLQGDEVMLIGADFFLSHRIYISRAQHKLYFTYNGGPVFNLSTAARGVPSATPATAPTTSGSAAAPPPPPMASQDYSNAPTDAPGFNRRAAAFAGRRDFTDAIDDLTHAIALDPKSADYVYQRALAHEGARQPVLAMADFDQTLKLKPDDIPALLARASLRLRLNDRNGAKLDLATAAKLAENDPVRRLGVAGAYEYAEMWDDAVAQLDLWIPAYPNDDRRAMALNARCWARARSGQDLDKAISDCDAALRVLPGDPSFLDSRALAYLRHGDFSRGLSDEQAILRLQPNNAWALYGRGWARVKMGQTDEGQADIKAATALFPRLPEEAKARGLGL